MDDWQTALQHEFEMAEAARARGNEGQARVCARRAAGIAIREYFRRRGTPIRSPSAYDLHQMFARLADTPPDLQTIAAHLTLRVNEEFTLPVEADLLAEARLLCARLLPDAFPPASQG